MATPTPHTNGVIPPTKLAHVVFRTNQIEAMKQWYGTVLGAYVVFENPMIAFLTFDDEHHRIALVKMPGLEPRGAHSVGMDHMAFTISTLGDLLATYERLKGLGITPYWCVNHGVTTSMYFRDPDGNQVELQVDNFDRVEDLHEWIRSEAFANNPIGVNFNPEKLIERFRSGTPLAELVQQGSA